MKTEVKVGTLWQDRAALTRIVKVIAVDEAYAAVVARHVTDKAYSLKDVTAVRLDQVHRRYLPYKA